MLPDRHKRLYSLHSWTGVLIGLFIYVVSFSGTIALFSDEILPWENPAARTSIPEDPIQIGHKFNAFLVENSKHGELEFWRLAFPVPETPYYEAWAIFEGPAPEGSGLDHLDTEVVEKWDPVTGEILPERGNGLSYWIRNFHRNLMLPRTTGRTVVGIVGIILMVSIITGILIHGKIIKNFFTLRLTRSTRLKWQDSHKVLGIFTLPFSTMIAFTGAYLGVVVILAPIIAFLAFQGDTETLFTKVFGEPHNLTGEQIEMISMDRIPEYRHPETGASPWVVFGNSYGDKNTLFEILYKDEEKLATFNEAHIFGATGEFLDPENIIEPISPSNRVAAALTPLHYATYGNIWLKWVYAVLGVSLCIITTTGIMMWVERRLHGTEGNKSDTFYKSLSQLNIGVSLGFPIATAALFIHDKLYTGVEADRIFWVGVTYFLVALATIIAAFLQKDGYKSVRQLMVALAAVTTAIPIVNLITTGATLWSASNIGESYSNGLDVSALVIAALTFWVSGQLPKGRNASKAEKKINVEVELPVAAE